MISNIGNNAKKSNFSEFLKKIESKDQKTNEREVKEKLALDKIREDIEKESYYDPNNPKTKLLAYSADETANKDEKTLHTYYCSLCGANVVVSDTMLELMPHRKTDDSIIVLVNKIFFKNYMRKDKLIVIKRDTNKYEKQYRYICQECGVFIAYQTIDFNEEDSLDSLKKRSQKIFQANKKNIVYILIDALVADARQSSLYIEMEKIKESQAKKNFNPLRIKRLDN